MSQVTNLILKTPTYFGKERERVGREINAFFDETSQRGVVNCDDESLPNGWYGGSRYLEAELWLGAFNYLNLDNFITHLKTKVSWDAESYDNIIQLIVQEQEDDKFRIIEFTLGGKNE